MMCENFYYTYVSVYLYITSPATDMQLHLQVEQGRILTTQQHYGKIIKSRDAE